MCVSVCQCVYQCCLDPVGVAHEVLYTLIDDFPIIYVELALIESEGVARVDFFVRIILGLQVLVLFFGGGIGVGGGFGRLEATEGWSPCPREDSDHQSLEEGLNDVHHIRAEVPDHVELRKDRQWRPVADPCFVAGMIFPVVPRIRACLRFLGFVARLVVRSGGWW